MLNNMKFSDPMYKRVGNAAQSSPNGGGRIGDDPRQGQLISAEKASRSARAISAVNVEFGTSYKSSGELYCADDTNHVRRYDFLCGNRRTP